MKMKQWIAICLVGGLLISGMPITTYAQEEMKTGTIETDLIDWVTYTGGMTLSERAQISMFADSSSEADYEGAKAAIVEGIKNWEEKIVISQYKIPIEDVWALYSEICYENPHLFYMNTSCGYTYYEDYADSINPKYNSNYTEADIAIYENRIADIMDTIPKNMSEKDAALALHDYLVSHCAYDVDLVNFDAYSALVWGDTVCQGYALAYADLLNRYGIENEYVVSDEMCHAWNLVKVDGEWYHVDTTWDDPLSGGSDLLGYVGHENLLRSDSGITETEHHSWVASNTCDDTTYDTYYWSGLTSAIIFEDASTCYYMEEGSLYRRNHNTVVEISDSASDTWYVWDGPGYWVIQFNKLALIGNVLYYTSTDTIYAYNLNTKQEIPYYTYTGNNGYIYGLAESIDGSMLQIEIRTCRYKKTVEIVSVEPIAKVALQITSHPVSQTVEENAYVTFSVGAEGEGLSYQWQFSKDGAYWSNSSMAGSNTASMQVQALASRNGYQYRCIVTDASGEQIVSNAAKLSVNVFKLLKQPKSQTVSENEYTTFAVEAEGAGLSYQWQFTKDGAYWSNSSMTGSNTASMRVQALASRDGYQYRCVITDGNGKKLISNAATLTVDVFKILKQPKSQTVKENEYTTFTVEAEGTGLSYQWQFTKDGAYWSNSGMSGSNTASMRVQALASRDGYQYRCVITDASGKQIVTDAARLTVDSLTIISHPQNQSVSENAYVIFAVEAEGTGLNYQWQCCKDGSYWFDSSMTGSNTASMKVQALTSRNGYQYRCVVTDANGNRVVSNAAKLTIGGVKIVGQPVSQSVGENEYITFSVKAEGTGLSYQWQCCKDGTYWFNSSMTGSNTASLRVQALESRNGYQYRCVVTDANGNEVVSDAAKLTIGSIKIMNHPESQKASQMVSVTFTVEAEGEGLSYQWQCCKDGVYWFNSSMAGSNTASIRVQALESRNGYQYRCVITDANGYQVISDPAELTIRTGETDAVYTVKLKNGEYAEVEGHFDEADAQEMLALVNAYRVENGLGILDSSKSPINEEAETRAVETSYQWDHIAPDGSGPRYPENIAYAVAIGNPTVEDVFQAWIDSEGHRNNILWEDFTYTAVKVFYLKCPVTGADYYVYTAYWVQLFT